MIAFLKIPLKMSDIFPGRWLTAWSRIIPLGICTKLYDLAQSIFPSSMHRITWESTVFMEALQDSTTECYWAATNRYSRVATASKYCALRTNPHVSHAIIRVCIVIAPIRTNTTLCMGCFGRLAAYFAEHF